MARVNVYLPDDLAASAKAAGINVSAVTQEALRAALTRSEMDRWLDTLEDLPAHDISHEAVLKAMDEGREDLFGAGA